MKNIILTTFSLFLFVGVSVGQKPMKTLKKASKDLAKYHKNPAENAGALDEAMAKVEMAFESEEVKSNPEAYNIKGEIFNSIADAEMKQSLIKPEFQIKNPEAGIKAYEAYTKALELATKKYHTKDALNGLIQAETHLSNLGITAFQKQDYKAAFKNFSSANKVYEILKENGKNSRLDDEVTRDDQYFYTGVAGYYGEMGEEALPILMKMYEAGTDKALVYEALYNIKDQMGDANAMDFLAKGRELNPEDTGLLFSEINAFLKKGKLDELIDKLKAAIAAEPDNVTVYTTLGNVYDQLTAKSTEAGDETKAKEYRDNALDYYNQTLEKEPNNFDALYSIGAIYYNQAAAMTEDINQYANDFSKEGTAKYNELNKKMLGMFDQALPFFQKAEAVNPKDINTIVALGEIYARKGDLEKTKQYKELRDSLSGQK